MRPPINPNIIAAAHDATMAALSFVAALYLRLGSAQFMLAQPYLVNGAALFTAISVSVFVYMRLYRGMWRYASLRDLSAIIRAVSVSIALFYGVLFLLLRLEGMPRSVPFIHWLLLLLFLGAPRFAYRAWKDGALLPQLKERKPRIPVILIGAQDAAELFVRALFNDPNAAYTVAGILDDDPRGHGRALHGIRIYGPPEPELLEIVVRKLTRKGMTPQRVIMSVEIEAERMRALVAKADALGLSLGRLPRATELKNEAEVSHIRPIAIEDLLGRAQNVYDREAMREFVAGQCVLVTGAGGTIGSELCRQIAGYGPKRIILFEQSEYALYLIDQELSEKAAGVARHAVLGDVRANMQLEDIFARHTPDIVFHAAAIKHVPLAEHNPLEALSTNVLGTKSVAEACIRHGVKAMVLISTDKAVHPVNVMGASKKCAELICQSLAASARASTTRFVAVRFGNVLGSTGSVVPLFQRQIAEGGPVTVTHPDMTRYFMTVREAVSLVIRAAASGMEEAKGNSAVYVLDMGTPVKIIDLARQMIRLSGFTPDQDIRIVYTGLRPGEKLSEELFYASEKTEPTAHASILRARSEAVDAQELEKMLELLNAHCRQRDAYAALAVLKRAVPQYIPHHQLQDSDHHADSHQTRPAFRIG